jgi:sulfocyanin SoxE-like protein
MPRQRIRSTMSGIAALLALGHFVACATAQTPAASPAPTPTPVAVTDTTPPWLVADSAARTVTIALQVTPAPEGGAALINGYRNGELQIVVPLNWTVQWDWRSADSTAPHSLVVMAEREKLPTEGGRAAFTNAMTRMVTDGLEAGQGDRTTFTADQAGWYWMLDGVPGHAIKGEYIGLRVDPEARTARAVVKRKT